LNDTLYVLQFNGTAQPSTGTAQTKKVWRKRKEIEKVADEKKSTKP
jgi:hypothetical protein